MHLHYLSIPHLGWCLRGWCGMACCAEQTWVKYVIVLDSNHSLRFTELIWCIRTYETLSKSANTTFWSFRLAQLHQARSIETRNISKPIVYLTQFLCSMVLGEVLRGGGGFALRQSLEVHGEGFFFWVWGASEFLPRHDVSYLDTKNRPAAAQGC